MDAPGCRNSNNFQNWLDRRSIEDRNDPMRISTTPLGRLIGTGQICLVHLIADPGDIQRAGRNMVVSDAEVAEGSIGEGLKKATLAFFRSPASAPWGRHQIKTKRA